MNFYNPYLFTAPATTGGLFRGISLSGILNGATRVLNFANQAIPMVKQVSPMVKNMKTMFQVMNEFKKVETPTSEEHLIESTETKSPSYSNNGPTFFV